MGILKQPPIKGVVGHPDSGVLLLILILLSLAYTKPDYAKNREPDALCNKPHYVQIVGDTPDPGVYAFCGDVRLRKALREAKVQVSFRKNGEISGDDPLPSGAKIMIGPGENGISLGAMTPHHLITLGIPIDVNRTSRGGLTALPGIGPALATRIVAERERRGAFKGLEDLLSVKGIGQGLFSKIAPYLSY
jgi:competence protein ComEA